MTYAFLVAGLLLWAIGIFPAKAELAEDTMGRTEVAMEAIILTRPEVDSPSEGWIFKDQNPVGSATPGLLGALALRFQLQSADEAAVHRYAQWFARTGLLHHTAARATLYLPHFVQEAYRRELPGELALLPYIESAFNPLAHSPARAVGICQFIPATGKRFALWQSALVDLRRDAVQCADAMYRYLAENYQRFGDWQLALAAYNAGEGAIARAVERNAKVGRRTDFPALNLPRETRNYVPALLGLARLVSDPLRYGVILPDLPMESGWRLVSLPSDVDVVTLLRLSGVDAQLFVQLNAGVLGPVVPRATHPKVALPYAAADRLEQAMAMQPAAAMSRWQTMKITVTTRLDRLAQSLRASEAVLRQANRIPSHHVMVMAGSSLLVPKTVQDDAQISVSSAQQATVKTMPSVRSRQVQTGNRLKSVRVVSKQTADRKIALHAGIQALKPRRVPFLGEQRSILLPIAMMSGQTLLLCTDGLHGFVTDRELAQMVQTGLGHPATPARMAQTPRRLLRRALQNQSDDDIAVMLLTRGG
jgi:membrane-bound lytic murein transglycosylase D